MTEDDDTGFAPPPYRPDEALLRLQRALRDAKLAARGNGFEWQGRMVAQLAADGATVAAKLARRATSTPEWDRSTLKSAADERKWLDEVRRRLERWSRED